MSELKTDWDVAIIGTGPAGMFAALELVKLNPRLRICMFEKGPLREFGDRQNKTCGWGGAGAFSDGKLDLTGDIGGNMLQLMRDAGKENEFAELMRYIEETYVSYCASEETHVETAPDAQKVEELMRLCHQNGMKLIPFPVRHLGTDRAYGIVMGMKRVLEAAGVAILTDHEVRIINPNNWGSFNLLVKHGEKETLTVAKKVVAATGREGDEWLWKEAVRLKLPVKRNRVDIGVRVEVRAEIMKHLTDVLHEPKIIYHTPCHNDRVRTFCVCPNGKVVKEHYRNLNVYTVNGESNSKSGFQTPNTNFALLVSQAFTAPFNDPTTYAASIARTTNMLAGGNGVLVQRLADIKHHRRTDETRIRHSMADGFIQPTLADAIPGDLSLAIPARHWCCIMATLEALDKIAPGVAGPHTLLYGAEVKFYSNQIEAPYPFETALAGLYVAGDGSGNTRGLL
ncbi:MAG: FAD-dependent oxidoreductase, partial [Candidatus Sungiibacteriota bacterium]